MDGLEALGLWYLALSPVILSVISCSTAKLALAAVPSIGLPSFVLTAVHLVFGGGGRAGAGVLTPLLALVALYAGLALLHEDVRRTTVLPTLRRGRMKDTLTGGFDDQLRDIAHEPGVREYLWWFALPPSPWRSRQAWCIAEPTSAASPARDGRGVGGADSALRAMTAAVAAVPPAESYLERGELRRDRQRRLRRCRHRLLAPKEQNCP